MTRTLKQTLRAGKLRAKSKARLKARAYQRKTTGIAGRDTSYLTTFAYSDIDQAYGKKPRIHHYSGDIRKLEAKSIRTTPRRRVRRGAFRPRPVQNLLDFLTLKKQRGR